MRQGEFETSREFSKNFLHKCGLLKDYQFTNIIDKKFKEISKENDYIKIYRYAIDHQNYHMLTEDDSFFQFQFETKEGKTTIRQAFYQNPYDFPVYKKYLLNKSLRFCDVKFSLLEQYEQEIFDAKEKKPFVAIRYDYSEDNYAEGCHSVSHFHFGFGNSNSIRVASSFLISPLSFVCFVVKQVYYDRWILLMKNKKFIERMENIKRSNEEVCEELFKYMDSRELFLI